MTKLSEDQGSVNSGDTQTAILSSNPDLARVFVRLANGTRIVIPVPQDASVHDLHTRVLQRAKRWLGPEQTSIDNTYLQTTGTNPAIVFGEDVLKDVMDLTDDNTFSLGTIGIPPVQSSTPQLWQSSATAASSSTSSATISESLENRNDLKPAKVYVRWITLEAALESSRLRMIPGDKDAIPCDTTLHDFHRIAKERLSANARSRSCTNPRKMDLYLKECTLHAEDNWATVRDIGSDGSEVLDVFVDFNGGNSSDSLSQITSSSDPSTFLGFDTTKRGLSTFIVSIQMLLKEINDGHCTLDNILEVLLEITHFPPLLLAFRSLHETGLESSTFIGPLMLVASAFHVICGKIVPSKICPSSSSFLEASRQIVCWIWSIRSEASLAKGSSKPLIHRAQIRSATTSFQFMPTFLPFAEVVVAADPDLGDAKRKMLVSIEADNKALCHKLGTAINVNAALPWDFYFQPDNWIALWDHKLCPLLHPNDFERLVVNTNATNAFKMVGPLQIGACLAAELPVFTLSSKGYVSRYDHEDQECSVRKFITWNPIDGKEILPDNAGQFLSQKLDPIVLERKKEDNWKLDAWPAWTKTADHGTPDEAIIICVDTSGSMDRQMTGDWLANQSSMGTNPSRLTEVKEFFKNLSLRISALNLSTHLGLVTFSSRAVVKQPLTPLHLNFNQQLDNAQAAGATSIFDALQSASLMLEETKRKYPQTKCRIILLTDGADNRSSVLPNVVATDLYKNNIVLDAVVIGPNQTNELFKIARHTGGYAFSPQNQASLFQIFLLETVVDIRTRPDLTRVPYTNWGTFMPKDADMKDQYNFPPCKPHPNLNDYFIALADAERFMNRMSRRSTRTPSVSSSATPSVSTRLSAASTVTAGAGGTSRILLSEIKAMIDNAHTFIDVYVSQSNMGFWKVVMQGPPNSPYEKGTFLLYVEIGEDFPRRPPSVRFVTPMLHPNITKHGRVCHPIFDREWTPATRIYQILQQLYGILMSLEARDAIDPLSALRFWSDEAAGRREVENYVNRFARRSRELYRFDIVGDEGSSTAGSSVATVLSPTHLNPFGNSSGGSSISGASTRSTSTLLGHLQNQRRPQPQPSQTPSRGNESNSNGSGNNPSLPSVSVSGSDSGSEAGSVAGGRRLSRRASFFARLRRAGG